MRPDDGRVIPNFLSQALDGRDLTVYGDGSQTRSFCYVDDLVSGLRSLMETDGLQGEVMNLGSDQEITILDLAETILEVCDTGSGIRHEPLPEDDPSRRRPDLSKARDRLGFEPTVGLRDGLERTGDQFTDTTKRSR
jgi:UDP-glucuronate decarboxylase